MADALEAFMGNSSASLAYTKADENPADLRKRSKAEVFGRKAQAGPLKLRGLSQRHLEILALHLSGDYSNKEIGQLCGISIGKVNAVLDDPLAQVVIEQHRNGQLMELEALLPKVTDTIRQTLDSGDDKVRLQAVDRFIKMSKEDFGEGLTQGNLAITIVDARTRFVDQLREIIDITPEASHVTKSAAPAEKLLETGDSDAPAE